MYISLIIDARSAGKGLPRLLAQARRLTSPYAGHCEILVADDDAVALLDIDIPSHLARVVGCLPAPLGRRLNMAASHSHGRMLGFCQGSLDNAWIERMLVAAKQGTSPVVRPPRTCMLSWARWQRRDTRGLGVERTWFDRLGGFDPALDQRAIEDLAVRLKACRADIITQRA